MIAEHLARILACVLASSPALAGILVIDDDGGPGVDFTSLQTATAAPLPFALKAFAIVPPDRALLHRRIADRFDAMLRAGLVDELRSLR